MDIMPIDLVEYTSTGRLLVLGSAEQIKAVSPYLDGLTLTTSTVAPSKIEGWLGHFSVEIKEQSFTFDLVLDLLEEPSLDVQVLPLGYMAPRDDKQKLAEALQQLPDLVGTFDKPRFFEYNPSICAHSRRQVSGCQQCIDACPAEAITSLGDGVSVNPSLCQGCGSCTSVCPSGAMSYALPTLDVSINRLRMMMKAYFEIEQEAPNILIHDETNGRALIGAMGDQLDNRTLVFSIEEIGALGMPFWLTAIAYGAASITVWDALSHDDHDWLALQNEVAKTNELLVGMDYAANAITWFQGNSIVELKSHLLSTDSIAIAEHAQYGGVDDKRRMTTIALAFLHKHAPNKIELLALDSGSAFGDIKIDKQACTLCMSCVSVCPAGAVLDGVDKPQLNFVEDLCVQCGLCDNACPENAISLNAQYRFDREQARRPRVLNEEPIFECITCRKPFATKKMIDTMMEKLKDHAMFQGPALERLKMCEDCRVKAMFKDSRGPM
jgi:ferredoxin